MKTGAALAFTTILILASNGAMASTSYTVTNGLAKAFTYKSPPFTAKGQIGISSTVTITASSPLTAGTVVGYTSSYYLNSLGKPVYSYCHYAVPSAGVGSSFNTTALLKTSCSSTP